MYVTYLKSERQRYILIRLIFTLALVAMSLNVSWRGRGDGLKMCLNYFSKAKHFSVNCYIICYEKKLISCVGKGGGTSATRVHLGKN